MAAAVALAVCGSVGSALAAAPRPAAEDLNTIHPDPAVRQGVLANGLRYLILRNATPPGAVSLRLAIDAGAYDETDDQLGAAHFVEHLAFSGGDNGHLEGPERAFAQAGVSFGRDLNAETGLFSTVYRLDLTKADPAVLAQAFGWLRTVADGTRFTPAAVDRERGIVLAEREAELSPASIAQQERQAFMGPGLRVTRPVIGTPASLAALDPGKLQAFYRTWYRPDNAVVVAVGDADPEQLLALVQKTFGGWTAAGPPPVRPAPGKLDLTRGEQALSRADIHMASQIGACSLRPGAAPGADDVARLRERLLSDLWIRLVDKRLGELTRNGHPPYLKAAVGRETDLREAEVTCLNVMLLDERWRPALEAAQGELSRFRAHGPSQDDLDEAIDNMRAKLRGARDQGATRDTSDLAGRMTARALKHDVVTTPNEDFWAFDAAVETITPDDVRKAFARDWSGAGPFLIVEAPQPPPATELTAAWDAGAKAAPPPAAPAETRKAWAYEDFGKAGRIVSRAAQTGPDFVRIRYANGVVLNFKKTDFAKDDVQVRVRVGAGRQEIPDADFFAANFGAGLLAAGGLGRHDFGDLQRLFANTGWEAKLAVGTDAFVLHGQTNDWSLRSELQVLAAFLSDPGFRPEVDARIPTAVETVYRQYRAQPAMALNFALMDALAPGSPATLPPQARTAALRMADFQRLLKPALTEAPIEVTIVGDIGEGTASEFVGETLGALPPRKDTPRTQASTWFMRFPDQPPALIRATHEGPADKAMVGLVWPLYVATPERRREEITLGLLAKVFDDDLRHRVRQELAQTYSPHVGTSLPDHADQGLLMAAVEASPQSIEAMRAETAAIAERLAKGQITEEELEAARKPLQAEYAARMTRNAWWVGVLDGSARTPEGLDEMRVEPGLLASVTLAEVREAAARWLGKPPIAVVVLPEAAARPASAATAAR
ncbi:M16 family metallopeptidase [Phenylobacterium montanum]|uniref:Insulinase family protein n=1 Tax=Phenylobacterium montanum TaxID=2823693 RepID=A0A975FYJ3_9CAUL|nr:M16 family metallopeptidase [Caulobacter sp. S6]QUD87339.1 insulinase family protein [Caulobacter sp. S6]